jgi:hypothetical protein
MATNPDMVDDEELLETVEEPSLADDLRAGMRELEGRDRDEHGRFKAKEFVEEAEAAQAAPVEAEAAPAEPEVPVEPEIAAPQSLSAEAKAKWADTPVEVRAAIAKRETEVGQLVGRMDGERQFGRAMNEAINPYMATIRASGGHPTEVVGNLLNTAYVLQTGQPAQKEAMLLQIAADFGIDIDAAYARRGDTPAPVQQAAPPVDINAEVERVITQREVEREAAAFMADPANVHLEAVRDTMAALLQGGQASTLQAAYDMAIYAHPDLRSTFIAAEVAKKEAQLAERAKQARQAAVSITGSSGSPRPADYQGTSLREELRTRYRALNGAV